MILVFNLFDERKITIDVKYLKYNYIIVLMNNVLYATYQTCFRLQFSIRQKTLI